MPNLRNNEITVKLLITDIFGCHDKAIVRNDVMNFLLNLKNLYLIV